MKYNFPNYKKNIVNISSTFNKMLGNHSDIPTLDKLEKYLNKGYKNVVFIIFDGFGIYPLKKHLNKDNILRKNVKQKLTSVFPSTTTNATTTLMSCEYPFNHGWFGWSVYFDELNRAVDVYVGQDSYTEEKVDMSFIKNRIPFSPYYKNNKHYEVNKVLPVYVKDGVDKNHYVYDSNEKMFEKIKECCQKEGKQFIYSYNGEPDSTMHRYGVSSKETHLMVENLSLLVEKLKKSLDDTLIVITADHGHVDIDEYIRIYENKELLDCLQRPISLEVRAASFKIKEGREEEFKRIFKNCYGKDFKLFNVDYLISKGVFGPCNEKNRDLLGDYIGVCKTNKMFLFHEHYPLFKGHHTSFGKEMFVPLIIIE